MGIGECKGLEVRKNNRNRGRQVKLVVGERNKEIMIVMLREYMVMRKEDGCKDEEGLGKSRVRECKEGVRTEARNE